MSRIVDNINRGLAESISYNDWLRSKSRLAIYFAQKGDVSASEREALEIRSALQIQSNARGVVYANLVEATICFQRGTNGEAMEKTRRAYALSKAMADKELIAMSSAWLAHFLFNAGQYESAITSASESLVELDVCEKNVLARASLVIASMFHFFDNFQSAKKWYDSARNAAIDEGDDVMIGMILYNMATYRLNNLRLFELTAKSFDGDTLRLNLEVASSSNFDFGVQSSAFPVFLPLLTAQVLTLDRKFSDAAELFEEWLCQGASGDMKRLYPALRADYAWCLANLGLQKEAMREISEVIAELGSCEAPDDRAMALHRVAMTYSLFGRTDSAVESTIKMRIALAEHQLIQRENLRRLIYYFPD